MNKEQITSTIRYFVMLIMFIAGLLGYNITEDTAQMIGIGVAMIILLAYGLWKNQNLTAAAALAQRVLNLLKENILTFEQVEQMIDDAEGKGDKINDEVSIN